MTAAARQQVPKTALIARRWLAQPTVVFLDTETTGLDDTAEICEIAILDRQGAILMDQRIRPRRPIPATATSIHGITDADVANCPTWPMVAPAVARALRDRPLIIYNASYDLRLLAQTAEGYQLDPPVRAATCAMRLYAEHYGERDDLRGGYRWQKLSVAAQQMGLRVPSDLHAARADAELTRRLLMAVAA